MALVLKKRVSTFFPFRSLPLELAEKILDVASGPLFKSTSEPRYKLLRTTSLVSSEFRFLSQFLLGRFVYLRDCVSARLWLLDSPKYQSTRWLEPPIVLDLGLLKRLLARDGGPRLMKLVLDAEGDDELFSEPGLKGLSSLELAVNLRAGTGLLNIPFELTHLSLAPTYPLRNHFSNRFIDTVLAKAQDSLLDLKFSTANWKVEDQFVQSLSRVAASLQRITVNLGLEDNSINSVFLPFFMECEQVSYLTVVSTTLPTNLPIFLSALRQGNKARSLKLVLDLSKNVEWTKEVMDTLTIDGLVSVRLSGIKEFDEKLKIVVKALELKNVKVYAGED